MRKRTIFRSSQAVLLGGALVWLMATPLAAQEPVQQQVPDVHVVTKGETLWGLAAFYFGDPLLWPEIYRLNTPVVEDPHWIFPGEELRMAGMSAAAPTPGAERPVAGEPGADLPPGAEPPPQAVAGEPQPGEMPQGEELPPPAPPPPPPSATGPTIFAYRSAPVSGFSGAEGYRAQAVSRHEFYSGGFLTEDQSLPWGTVSGAIERPAVRRIPASSYAGIFDKVAIVPPANGAYQVGDTLLFARLLRGVPGWGQVVYPTGVVVVSETAPEGAVGTVLFQFDRINNGHLALPIEPFADPGSVMPVPVQNGMMGSIIGTRLTNPVPGQLQIVFIDLGRNAGIVPGDVFTVLKYSAGEAFSPKQIAEFRIVHVRDQSATGLIMNVMDIGLQAGSPVQLVKKMPS
jgi:hypothetical protein